MRAPSSQPRHTPPVLLAAALVLSALVGCGSGGLVEESVSARSRAAPDSRARTSVASGQPVKPFRFYSPSSFWNTQVPATAPLDPKSGPIVAAFNSLVASELREKAGPSINTTEYSVPIYTVPAQQPTVKVTLDSENAPALQDAWNAVPVPPKAQPAKGTDGRLVIWQPSSDKLWDFWRAVHKKDGWHASWGGATQDVSSASGLPDAASWPGAQPWWGTSGCSLGVVGGLITIEDINQELINHALQIAIPNVRAGVYASPALRTDGQTHDPLALPEGARLRLDPSLDLRALHLPRLTLMMARAAKHYGIFVINRSKDVAFQAQDPVTTGGNPYIGPDGYFEGSYPRELLSQFPWEHLQLLKTDLHPYG